MFPSRPGYKAYILRVWQREQDAVSRVVASLEDPRTCRQVVFAGLPELLHYLEQVVQNNEKIEEG